MKDELKTLYISDLDATLFNSSAELSDKSIQIINELISEGCLFTVATARSFATTMKKCEKLNLTLPMVLMNGVILYDPIKRRPILTHKIEKSAADEVLKIFENLSKHPILYFENDGVLTAKHNTQSDNKYQSNHFEDEANRFGKTVIKTSDLSVNEGDNLIYIVNIDICASSKELYKQISSSGVVSCTYYKDHYTDAHFLETTKKDVSKAVGALDIKKMLGIDKIIAFGDNYNDLPLFEIADECYAVSNACSAVKEKADGIIDSNDQDGVAKFLLAKFKGER